jgi:extradiol dioxygenase family protein
MRLSPWYGTPIQNASASMPASTFHLAITVDDLTSARAFYAQTLGADVVAETQDWIVFDFFGHKVTVNLVKGDSGACADDIALRHFGVMLDVDAFHDVNARLMRDRTSIVTPAQLHDEGSARAQWVLFVQDPSGNGLEFNAFPGGDWHSPLV